MPIFGVASKSTSIRGFLSLLASAALLAVSFTPLVAAPAASAATLDVTGKAFSFTTSNRTLSSPESVGGYALYTNVTNVDGISINVKITTETILHGDTTITNYDNDGQASGNADAFQVDQDIQTAGGAITYLFEFFDAATGQAVVLKNVAITSIDLDGPGRQFAEFSSFQTYTRASTTLIQAFTTDGNNSPLTDGLVRFAQSRSGIASTSSNIPSTAIQVNYSQLGSFRASFGNELGSGPAYYGLTFKTLCNYASSSGCVLGAAVNNPNNTAPTSSNTSLNYLNDGTTWTALPLDRFPYSDADNNPFTQVKITALPATGSLQQFINGAWSDVALNEVISKDAIAAGFLRYRGTVDASLGFQVHDGLTYSASYSLALNARLQAQTITFNTLPNKTPNFASFPSNASASSGLTVVLVSETPDVCTVTGTSIFAVTGATGTCTIRATQPGDADYAAAASVTQSFQVTTKTDQTIALANPGDQTWSGSNYTVTAAVTPDATSNLGVTVVSLTTTVCTVVYTAPGATATVTIRATGSCQLRATQAGNSTYAPANPVVQTFNVASANQQAQSYTVTFNGNGSDGGSMSAQNASASTALTSNAFTLTGYTFGGWSATQNGSLAYADGAAYPFSSSTTLYAIWTANAPASYTVTFDNNGGSGSMNPQSASTSTAITSNTFTKNGFTFGGWSATQNGSLAYADGAAYPFSSSTTLYAIWTANAPTSYTVTFNGNGSDGGSMSAQSASASTALTSNAFTLTGYSFGGWSATQNGSLAYADGAAYPFSSSTTLYAIWTANGQTSFTVTFDATDGAGSMNPQSASSATALNANTFTRSGYTFAGWATTRNGSVAYANLASYPFTSSTTLYALWTAIAVAPVAPTIAIPGGSTTGIAPVTLTPSIVAPSGIGSRCLVDPADGVCKQSVTLPGKGTFVLNANGSVTFTAVLGWTGTATVQYRVTSANGLSAEAPVTVVVAAPIAPTVTGGSGQTITTVPANVTPQISGIGSACLIDPADDVCKQRVFIPGKGTMVLNANGTVTFTAVAGFIGTVTVQLQVTDAYGQSARGPVTFTVGSSSQLQTGATTGTAPVVLSPNVKPEPGSACLVDPNDTECKSVVTIPEVGTWNLNPTTGSVTFKAVAGYVGTTVVQYRILRAGFKPTETPFVVTVAKKRPPVTVTIGGFNPGSPILTSAIKAQIAAFMKAYVGYRTIECIGFTMGPTVLKVDKWLSTTRAINGCDYVLKTLKSKVKALPLKNKMETVLGSQIRRVTLTLRD